MVFHEAPKRGRGEVEPRSRVTAQFVFFHELSPSIVSAIEKSAEAFFSPEPKVKNIFVVDGSFLRGFDYPHFWKWYELSGNRYFDGYLQHGKTGADGEDKPFTQSEINDLRGNFLGQAEMVSIYPDDFSDQDRHEISFYSTLLMLDRLAASRNFTLAVEPLKVSDVRKLYRDNREIFKPSEDEAEGADEVLEPEELVQEFLKESQQTYAKEAALYKQRLGAFDVFLEGVVAGALERGEETRIFVPREYMSYLTDFRQFADPNLRAAAYICNDPQFVDDLVDPYPTQRILAKFIKEEHASVTREEAIAALVANLIEVALPSFGMNSVRDKVPEVVNKATAEELAAVFKAVGDCATKGESWGIVVMDFFGMKTSGMRVGSIFHQLRGILHPEAR